MLNNAFEFFTVQSFNVLSCERFSSNVNLTTSATIDLSWDRLSVPAAPFLERHMSVANYLYKEGKHWYSTCRRRILGWSTSPYRNVQVPHRLLRVELLQ